MSNFGEGGDPFDRIFDQAARDYFGETADEIPEALYFEEKEGEDVRLTWREVERQQQHKKAREYWLSQKDLSDEEWCYKHLKIIDKSARLCKFKFNDAQKVVADIIRSQIAETGRVQLVILKARQLGISLVVQALFFRILLENPNYKAMVIAHEEGASDKVFERTRIFRDETKPMYPFTFSNRKEIVFAPPLRSSLEVEIATQKGKGRGGTYQMLHLTEVAFWVEARRNLAAVQGGFTDTAGSWIIWESTAFGIGGEFYNKYWKSKKQRLESNAMGVLHQGYREVFLPWFIDRGYRIPGARLADFQADPETLEDEPALRKAGCTDEQLAYRRHKIDSKYNGNVEMWKQEMPSNDIEAFIAAGRSVFLKSVLNKSIRRIEVRDRESAPARFYVPVFQTPKYPMAYEDWRKLRRHQSERAPVRVKDGHLWVYEMPIDGEKYLISSDVALGIEVNNDEGKKEGDYSVSHVYNRYTGRQAAVLRLHVDPDLYGCCIDNIGRWYNNALAVPEENSFGLTVIKALQRLSYPNLYLREKIATSAENPEIIADRYGWQTTGGSKTVAVGSLIRMFRQGKIVLEHFNTLVEMSTFVFTATGGMEASGKSFDDEVIAAAIASAIMETLPEKRPAGQIPVENLRSPAFYLRQIQKRHEGESGGKSVQVV